MSNRMRFVPTAVAAGVTGAAIMFFVDPQSGRRRRKETAERTAAAARHTARTAERATRRARAQTDGLRHRAIHAVTGAPRPVANEEMLADRVRSELFRDARVPKGALNINVERDGVVVLRGEVRSLRQIEDIEHRVRDIPGVRDVENLLHQRGTPAPMHT
jgi:osmotically-inducible protein OsmY